MSRQQALPLAAEGVDPDYPIDPVPDQARKGAASIAVVLLGFTFFTPTMLVGAQVGAAFRLSDFLAVMVIGSLVLGLYVAVLAVVGASTRLTTVMLCRYTLGERGSKLASLLLGLTQVGWYGVGVATLGNLLAQAAGWGDTGARITMLVGAVVMGATAYAGFRGCSGSRRRACRSCSCSRPGWSSVPWRRSAAGAGWPPSSRRRRCRSPSR